MESRIWTTATVVFALAIAAVPATRGSGQVIQLQPTSVSGKIVSVAPGAILVEQVAGGRVLIKVPKPGEKSVEFGGAKADIALTVVVTGELPPSALQRGAYVKFPCLVDTKGNVKGEIKRLTMFKPQEGYRPGMYEDAAAASGENAAGAKEAEGASGYLVSGLLSNVTRKGVFTVSVPKGPGAPRGTVKGKIAADAVVGIEGSEYLMGRPGDDITAQCGKYKNDFVGQQIKITLVSASKPEPRNRRGKKGPASDPFAVGPDDEDQGADKKGEPAKPDGKKKPAEDDPAGSVDDPKPGTPKADGKDPDGDAPITPRKKNPNPKVLKIK
jgi:hypothetical protein